MTDFLKQVADFIFAAIILVVSWGAAVCILQTLSVILPISVNSPVLQWILAVVIMAAVLLRNAVKKETEC